MNKSTSAYNRTGIKPVFSVDSIVTLYSRELPRGYEHKGERHDFWELLYVNRGRIGLNVDELSFSLKPGELIVYPPDSFHSSDGRPLKEDSSVAIVSFVCSWKALHRLGKRVTAPDASQKERLKRVMLAGKRVFEPLDPADSVKGVRLKPDADPIDLQIIKNELELLLISLVSGRSQNAPAKNNQTNLEDGLAAKIDAYLRDNMGGKLTVNGISSAFGVSPSYVQQVVKSRFGSGTVARLNQLRLEEAKRLIRESTLNFTQIADRLGFGSVHYFSRLFRKKTGMSPSEYSSSIVWEE